MNVWNVVDNFGVLCQQEEETEELAPMNEELNRSHAMEVAIKLGLAWVWIRRVLDADAERYQKQITKQSPDVQTQKPVPPPEHPARQ